jgi:D-alanyl-D-alanine dipeptidase
MKPYQIIPIRECDEPLVSIPPEILILESPHPYQKLGANYQGKSPYSLRQGVLDALIKAQNQLQSIHLDWKIKVFDAYRPIEVQRFMVNYTFDFMLAKNHLNLEELAPEETEKIWQKVYQFWAIPSDNPATPPPHSTGAAVDVTLVDQTGKIVDFGGEIDEISPRSFPNYYAKSPLKIEKEYHNNRELLRQIMEDNGLIRHPQEWWHFSLGDQMWAWQIRQKFPEQKNLVARYGMV